MELVKGCDLHDEHCRLQKSQETNLMEKKMKSILALIILFGCSLSNAAIINCLDKNEDKFLCTQVIDLSKVESINCLSIIEDGVDAQLCSAIKTFNEDGTEGTFNCLEDGTKTNDPYIIAVCSRLPKPNTIHKINCWEDLEDGYQVNLCLEADTNSQEWLHKVLYLLD